MLIEKKYYIQLMSKRMSTSDFVKRAISVHGNKYNYENTEYITSNDKVVITCKVHGDFELRAANHLLKNGKAQGCRKCAIENNAKGLKSIRAKTIFEDFRSIHGKRYDYSESIYHGLHKKMKIICKTHGAFLMTPASHFHQKSNCPDCVTDYLKSNGAHNRLSTDEFIKRALAIHGNVYDYSLTEFTGMHSPVKIICKEHGLFEQSKAQNHLENEFNCPVCLEIRFDEHQQSRKTSFEEAKQRVFEIHRNTVTIEDFSKYVNTESKITFRCNRFKKHGTWEATLHQVTSKSEVTPASGCPICKMSKGEKAILFRLKDENIKVDTQKYFKGTGKKRFDFFVPTLNLVIEFNGRQHYEEIELWGGKEGLKSVQKHDEIKKLYCIKNGIKFEVIRYDEDVETRMNEILNKYRHDEINS